MTKTCVAVAVLLLGLSSGCGGNGRPSIPAPNQDGGAGAASDLAVQGDCGGLGPARGPSESCCSSFGIDACGAGLLCAALDGRTIPVCYAVGSRMSGQSCTVDGLCVSGACNMTLHECKASVWETCDPSIGCGPAQGGKRASCAMDDYHRLTCQPVGDGSPCAVCESDADCYNLQNGPFGYYMLTCE
jgi:hypothetical protein